MTEKKHPRIAGWDGLRGIAIILVLVGHGWHAYGHRFEGSWLRAVQPIIGNSSFGVRLFFVLSGYLITQLLLNETAQFGKISLVNFFARRSLRIFPAFYFFICVVIVLSSLQMINVSKPQLVAAATYTWNYAGTWHPNGPAEGAWFLGHLWTLSLEEQFYLLWPLTLIYLGPKRSRCASLLIPLLMPFVRIGWYFAFPAHRGFLGMMLHTAIDSILVGCAFAMWQTRFPRRLERLITNCNVLAFVCLFVFILSPLLSIFVSSYRITIGFLLDAIGAGVLVLNATRAGTFSRVLSWYPLAWLGKLSYSIYLWQQLFLTPYNQTISGSFPACVFFIFLAALASYYLIEQPVLKFKGHFNRSYIDPSQTEVNQ